MTALNRCLKKSENDIRKKLNSKYARKRDSEAIAYRIALEDQEYRQFIRENWKSTVDNLDTILAQHDLATFFRRIEAITRYTQFERRDGSIISVLKDDKNNLITSPNTVSQLLIDQLAKIQGEMMMPSTQSVTLSEITTQEAQNLMKKMSKGKGISFDLISDELFHTDIPQVTEMLRKIWTIPLSNLKEKHFDARLVALNKVHPNIPKANEFRPIIVMSPLIKFMEARLIPKLSDYTQNRMLPSQTGFVKGFGCEVNIKRLITRGKEVLRTCIGTWCIVFFDFSSAYNTVNREILYRRLRNLQILTSDEVTWLQSLHDRITIRDNNSKLRTKNGVHQGSMISPLLFDIYVEPIIEALHSKLRIPIADILFYADDLAIIIPINQLERAIRVIEETAQQLNLTINKKKSGILILEPPPKDEEDKKERGKKRIKLPGYPYVDVYKYLGVEVQSDLEITPYIAKITKKEQFLRSRLRGILNVSSLETRKTLWSTLVRPLLDYIFPFYEDMKTITKAKILSILKGSFKVWVGLRVTTSNSILNILIGDIHPYIDLRAQHAKAKIILRFGKEKGAPMYELNHEKINLFPSLTNIPNQFFKVMNKLGWRECESCTGTRKEKWLTWYHLSKHGIRIRNPELVLEYRIKEWEQVKQIKNAKTRRAIINFLLFKNNQWQKDLDNIITLIDHKYNTHGLSPLNNNQKCTSSSG